jgi:hypothetical protein
MSDWLAGGILCEFLGDRQFEIPPQFVQFELAQAGFETMKDVIGLIPGAEKTKRT